jgi:hypothetical protein
MGTYHNKEVQLAGGDLGDLVRVATSLWADWKPVAKCTVLHILGRNKRAVCCNIVETQLN